MIHDRQSAQISQKQDERNIYAIMKTMYIWGHDARLRDVTEHHVPKCMSCHKTIVVITGRARTHTTYTDIHIYI